MDITNIFERVEKLLPKYEKNINSMFENELKNLEHFTCVFCNRIFNVSKKWKCPKCGEEYKGYSEVFNTEIAEKLCVINTNMVKEALGTEYDDFEEDACKLGKCPLKDDCPLEAI